MPPSLIKKDPAGKSASGKSPAKQVMQFKVTLRDLKPLIWRRIQVPASYSFWDLHVAIQDAMGWLDYHLHQFQIRNPKTGTMDVLGIPADEGVEETLADWARKIDDYFSKDNPNALYEYDFGDGWHHAIALEQILPAMPGVKYPVCVAGARRCPPEDCGGVGGFQEFLKAIKDPRHEEHESMLEWIGGAYDPKDFDALAVRFDNPRKRWKQAFEEE